MPKTIVEVPPAYPPLADTQVILERQDLRLVAEQIIDLCDPIFAEHATDKEVDGAVADIVSLLDGLVTHETEHLRTALEGMVRNHRYRFPLSGICHCDACAEAAALVDGDN